MKNKQPFYHRADLIFTAIREVSRDELETAIRSALKNLIKLGIIGTSVEVEDVEWEAGDPDDLM
jgi:hypothetical protein